MGEMATYSQSHSHGSWNHPGSSATKDGACQIDLAGIGGVDGQKKGAGEGECRGREQRVVGAA